MLFDVAYLRISYRMQHPEYELKTSIVSNKIYYNQFEYLVFKMFRCLFDNKRTNSITLTKFRNNANQHIYDEYKSELTTLISKTRWKSPEFKNVFEQANKSVELFRHHNFAHSLLKEATDTIVTIDILEDVILGACELFQALSFEPQDFYSYGEGDGITFEKEKYVLDILIEQYIRTRFLSSDLINNVTCNFNDCDEHIMDKLKKEIELFNKDR